jgi:adenylate kinase
MVVMVVLQLATLMSQGQLLPDDIIIQLLSKHLEETMESGRSGFILDGFPYTLHQAVIMFSSFLQ